eukprot:Phypoly_transcript_11773.p1 GENE.Phypoly_transcript_11773~~Phypoly_transcript_11773.p1  ORF type:complete len:221 (+),score=35.05 Phypoly_transcript_11773:246-908(+)
MTLEEWKEWFMGVCTLIFKKLPESECAIFCQTDIKIAQGNQFEEWVDKSYLCQKACEGSDCKLMFHKIVAFNSDTEKIYLYYGKLTGYSHMLCFRKKTCLHSEIIPDVIFRGDQVWEKGSGFNSTLNAVKYCKHLGSKCIIDPFCGKGSILAVANHLGLNAIGVEIKGNLSRQAMNLKVDETNEKNCFVWQDKEGEDEEKQEKEERRQEERKQQEKIVLI